MDQLPLASYTLPVYLSPKARFLIGKQTNKQKILPELICLVSAEQCLFRTLLLRLAFIVDNSAAVGIKIYLIRLN